MKRSDIQKYEIEERVENAMSLMKEIGKLSTNDVEKYDADYCFHKLENLLVAIRAIAEKE